MTQKYLFVGGPRHGKKLPVASCVFDRGIIYVAEPLPLIPRVPYHNQPVCDVQRVHQYIIAQHTTGEIVFIHSYIAAGQAEHIEDALRVYRG